MTPRTRDTTRHRVIETAIGPLTVVCTDDGLTGLYFAQHSITPDPSSFGPRGPVVDFAETAEQVAQYLSGHRTAFDLPLGQAPTERMRRMREKLLAVPYGHTTSYGTLSQALGITPREVGWLNAHNPISIVVPCHRVIGSNGTLTGYAGGIHLKARLLALEGALPPTPKMP